MSPQTETRIMQIFSTEKSLTVDVVDGDGNAHEETFYTKEDAIRDISNLECEFDVYGPW